MPPHLRHGIPVDQRLPRTPQPLFLCTCWQCYSQTAINQVTLEVERGAYVTRDVYRQHLSEDTTRGIAPPIVLNTMRAPAETGFPIERLPPRPRPTSLGRIVEDVANQLPTKRSRAINHGRLVFAVPPTPTSLPMIFQGFGMCDGKEINSGPYALDYSAPENQDILAWEEWLTGSLQHIERGKASPDIDLKLRSTVTWKEMADALEEVDDIRAREWERQRVLLNKGAPDRDFSSRARRQSTVSSDLREMEPFVSIPLLLVATAHLLCHLSIDHCSFVLACLRATITATAKAAISVASSFDPTSLSKSIPSDVRTVIERLDLAPVTRSFVCCLKCFTCHPITQDAPYPDRCTHKETPSSSCCNHPLRKTKLIKGRQKSFPVRRYLVHSLKDWISKLLNQPEVERVMDEYPMSGEASGDVDDIWGAKALRDLKGPDGKPFVINCGKEGRYVFSICFDGLNYDGNKHGGRKASVCAIYLVCLNLPPQLRYKFQNLFLAAVVPGPGEPSLHQINHVLVPLVDDLLELYIDGVTIRTANHQNGRLVRSALGPLVSDLLAARQMAGFSSHSSKTFCPHCSLTLDEISNTDKSTWGPKNPELLKAQAQAWRNAESEAVRDDLWKTNGVRWTELQRLPYWEPSKFMTIDPMHLLYLGNLQRHCRKVWGMDDKHMDGVGITHDQLIDPSQYLIDKGSPEAAMDALKFGTNSEVASFHLSALKQVCRNLGLHFGGKKKALVNALKGYRADMKWPMTKDSSPATTSTLKQTVQQQNRSLVDENKEEIAAAERVIMASSSSSKDLEALKKDAVITFLISQHGTSDRERLDGMSKQALMKEIKEWRRENCIAREQKRTRVLGRQVLGEIWSDMENTHLPSSVTPLPKNVGSAQAGSLGADEWRTLCLIHLPITLIRLWGDDVSSRVFQMLSNFMDLITAVKLASMRTTSAIRIQSYEFYMQRYLSQLLVLYPGATITPNHHLSLHLPEILDRFGPSHVFRAFVFERGNLILQQTPTNNKMDELTPTLMTRFCQKQRLRTLFDGLGSSEALLDVVQKFNHVFNSDLRGTVNEFFVSGSNRSPSLQELQRQMTVLPGEIPHLLGEWRRTTTSHVQAAFVRATFLTVSTICNVRVTTWRTSPGDSHVAFHEQDGGWSAGRVREIFIHIWHEQESLKGKVFLIVDVFSELSVDDALNDPYRKFPIAGGRMFLDRFSGTRVISDEEFWCHFARYDQLLPEKSTPCITAIPLDKE